MRPAPGRTLDTVSEIEIRVVRFDAPVAQDLIHAALADLGARYGGTGDDTPWTRPSSSRPTARSWWPTWPASRSAAVAGAATGRTPRS